MRQVELALDGMVVGVLVPVHSQQKTSSTDLLDEGTSLVLESVYPLFHSQEMPSPFIKTWRFIHEDFGPVDESLSFPKGIKSFFLYLQTKMRW